MEETVVGDGNRNALAKIPEKDREEKLRTQPVYSEGEDNGDDLVRQFFITRFERQPEQDPGYFETWKERLSKPNPEGYMDSKSKEVWDMVNGHEDYHDEELYDSPMNEDYMDGLAKFKAGMQIYNEKNPERIFTIQSIEPSNVKGMELAGALKVKDNQTGQEGSTSPSGWEIAR